MSRIGHDDFLALLITTRAVIVVDGHEARQLTMCTSVWFEGEMC